MAHHRIEKKKKRRSQGVNDARKNRRSTRHLGRRKRGGVAEVRMVVRSATRDTALQTTEGRGESVSQHNRRRKPAGGGNATRVAAATPRAGNSENHASIHHESRVHSTLQWLPNALTGIRVLLVPALVIAFQSHRGLALGVFLAAAITDALDGIIARRFDASSELGRFLDPVADKLIVSAALVLLASEQAALPGIGAIQPALAVTIIAREVGVSALREFAAERNIIVHVSSIGKAKTASQLTALTALLACRVPCILHAMNAIDGQTHVVVVTAGVVLLVTSAVLAVVSAAEYCRGVVVAAGNSSPPS